MLVGPEFVTNSAVIVKQQGLYQSETIPWPPQIQAMLLGPPVGWMEAGAESGEGLE